MSIPQSVTKFPESQVSEHVFKILEVAHSVLEECCSPDCSPFLAGRLSYATRLIFDLYRDIITVYHADAVAQFPQVK